MDYGHQSSHGEPPFFTSGVGNNPASVNNFEAEHNLDLTSPGNAWHERSSSAITPTPERPAIFSADSVTHEQGFNQAATVIDDIAPLSNQAHTPELGVIIGTDPSPAVDQSALVASAAGHIRSQGERISEATVEYLDGITSEFRDTAKPLSDTYNEVSAAREAYKGQLTGERH